MDRTSPAMDLLNEAENDVPHILPQNVPTIDIVSPPKALPSVSTSDCLDANMKNVAHGFPGYNSGSIEEINEGDVAKMCENDCGFDVDLSSLKVELLQVKRRESQLKALISSRETRNEDANITVEENSISTLVSALSSLTMSACLPKIEIEPFSGSAAEFVGFRNAFNTQIASKLSDECQKLAYLNFYCKGQAKESIKHCCLLPTDTAYLAAWKILEAEFGKPYQIVQEVTDKLFNSPPIREGDTDSLRNIARQMRSCSITLNQVGRQADLNCTVNLVRLVRRLPRSIQQKWADFAESVSSVGHEPVFDDLLNLIEKRVSVASTEYGRIALGISSPSSNSSNTHKVSAVITNQRRKCPLCPDIHYLDQCQKFRGMNLKDRWDTLKRNGCCFKCLKQNHRALECKSSFACTIQGCHSPHHHLLHPLGQKESETTSSNICALYEQRSSAVQLGFIPVCLVGPRGKVRTYAFLDNGSDCTLMDKAVAAKIGLTLDSHKLTVTTLHGTQDLHCWKTNVSLEALENDFQTVIKSIVVERLPISHVTNEPYDIDKWPHIRDVPFLSLSDHSIGIMIGCDVPEAHWVIDQRLGSRKQPYAAKSPFGWVLRGPMYGTKSDNMHVHTVVSHDASVEKLMNKLYNSEFADVGDDEEKQSSLDDDYALNLVETSTRLFEGHYEVPVPWRIGPIRLPDNRSLAFKRLMSLKHKLTRNPDLKERYTTTMEKHVEQGHISRVTDCAKRWFLPHHAVLNPKKPDKLRVVFDCAARMDGTSLNEVLLQGPDWTNNLVGVLLRFRRHFIGISADIKEMFLQVKLADSDKWAFSLLWWPDNDLNRDPSIYQWNVHPFGATSSPFCANFALHRTIVDNVDPSGCSHPSFREFYVDDYLVSVDSIDAARCKIREARETLAKGGFHLTKWSSNNEEVLYDVPLVEKSAAHVKLESNDIQRTLGLQWHISKDVFKFAVETTMKPSTRRSALSLVSSIYDPLGLVAPVVLNGKLILQDLCRSRYGWDTPLQDIHLESLSNWIDSLQFLEPLEFQRCIKPSDKSVVETQLHIFSDASELAYGAVAYVRQVLSDGSLNCALIFGKSRVAPLKFITIPRLELTAALLSAKILSFLLKESGLEFSTVTLWTDSAIVLHYLTNTAARYATFVANRVRRIRDLTSLSQWRYVPTAMNPADLASRRVRDIPISMSYWMRGPDFLWLPEKEWSKDSITPSINSDEIELKRSVMAVINEESLQWFESLCNKCSSWYRLLRSLAWLKRFKNYLLLLNTRQGGSIDVGNIKVKELRSAVKDAIRLVQKTEFSWERTQPADGDVSFIPRELRRLKPVLSENVLCLGGRVNSKLMILPSRSRVTELIVEHYHSLNGHAGPTHCLAAVRREFWIVHGMTSVKRILWKCARCRLSFSPFCQQVMAPLPGVRIENGTYPFKYCGVDFFGPFTVKVGRNMCKRFGCLFTCMQIRAIHIEICHDLSTDSFLLALLRFISRRGPPTSMYSDNGTNFVGADTELKRLLRSFDQDKIANGLLKHEIEWNFGPPYASHRGGVWERMIRSVRRVLSSVVMEQTPTDEVLLTCMAEAERIVNDRPLVPVYDDPEHSTILRPNDLILLRENIGIVNDEVPLRDRYTKRWRQAQHLATSFWKRWYMEYLPTLQLSQKWLMPNRSLRVGDLVLIHRSDTRRGHWPKGIVTCVHPGQDGRVRKVTVRTSNGEVLRDIRSLCLLEGVEE